MCNSAIPVGETTPDFFLFSRCSLCNEYARYALNYIVMLEGTKLTHGEMPPLKACPSSVLDYPVASIDLSVGPTAASTPCELFRPPGSTVITPCRQRRSNGVLMRVGE